MFHFYGNGKGKRIKKALRMTSTYTVKTEILFAASAESIQKL